MIVHADPMLNIDQRKWTGPADLARDDPGPARAANARADRDVTDKIDLSAAHHQARHSRVRQSHSELRRAVGSQVRLTGRRVEEGDMPSARQQVALRQPGRVAVEQRRHSANQRKRADFVCDLLRLAHRSSRPLTTRTARPTHSSRSIAAITSSSSESANARAPPVVFMSTTARGANPRS